MGRYCRALPWRLLDPLPWGKPVSCHRGPRRPHGAVQVWRSRGLLAAAARYLREPPASRSSRTQARLQWNEETVEDNNSIVLTH